MNIDPKIKLHIEAVSPPPEENAPQVDPLADALLYLSAHHGRAITREALIAGLPLPDGKLNVGVFERAAKRAGLDVSPVKRPLEDIPALVLPAILIMQDGTTRILLATDTGYVDTNPFGARSNRERRADEDGLPVYRVLAFKRGLAGEAAKSASCGGSRDG